MTRTRDERRATETLVDFRCEALVLLGPVAPPPSWPPWGGGCGGGDRAPGRRRRGRRGPDGRRRGVGQVVDHLAALGHRSITYVDGAEGTIAADRRRGCRAAMRRHGLAGQVRVIAGDHTEAAGSRAGRTLLDSGALPGAVVAYNDSCALGLLDAFNRAGSRSPRRLGGGYDDNSLAGSPVNLTTVSQDAGGQARARGGRGRGAPRRRPGAAPRGRAPRPAWSSGAPPAPIGGGRVPWPAEGLSGPGAGPGRGTGR